MNGNPFDPRDRQRRFEHPDLTRSILDRTSGRACARAEALLGARWDGDLEPTDADLLDVHLEHCAGCRETALILDRLQPLLPGLAEREPGPAFTTRVLARTSGRAASVPARGGLSVLDRVAMAVYDHLLQLWNRPRFALEAAWIAATLSALLIWSPLAPSGAVDRASGVAQAGLGLAPAVVQRLDRLAGDAWTEIEERLAPVGARLESAYTAASDEVRQRITTWQADLSGENTTESNQEGR